MRHVQYSERKSRGGNILGRWIWVIAKPDIGSFIKPKSVYYTESEDKFLYFFVIVMCLNPPKSTQALLVFSVLQIVSVLLSIILHITDANG